MAEPSSESTGVPLVSIGVPVYNGAAHVQNAIDCMLAQDYPNIEIVVSDNASTDGTSDILRECAAAHPNIRLRVNDSTSTITENFKRVLADASGEFFMWAAADDAWAPTFVSRLLSELMGAPDAGVAMCAVDRVFDDGAFVDTVRFAGPDDPTPMRHIELARALTTPRKYNYFIYGLFRTHVLREAVERFPEVPGEDRIMLTQLALATRFRYVDEPLQTKTLYREAYEERRPDESRSRMISADPLVDFRMIAALARAVLGSTAVPSRRKLFLPILACRYARLLLANRVYLRLVHPGRRSRGRWDRLGFMFCRLVVPK